MDRQIAAYEARLTQGARQLEAMEAAGNRGVRYARQLRGWLELLAAYEYESEMSEVRADLAAVV